jgi:hypothetical protein
MKAVWWALAYAACTGGLAWLALSMEAHWRQLGDRAPLPARRVRLLRGQGAAALAASLAACLQADRASMAALVWIMLLAAAALTVAFTLSWRPRWLAPLVAWWRVESS